MNSKYTKNLLFASLLFFMASCDGTFTPIPYYCSNSANCCDDPYDPRPICTPSICTEQVLRKCSMNDTWVTELRRKPVSDHCELEVITAINCSNENKICNPVPNQNFCM